jgi:hypothetical protein
MADSVKILLSMKLSRMLIRLLERVGFIKRVAKKEPPPIIRGELYQIHDGFIFRRMPGLHEPRKTANVAPVIRGDSFTPSPGSYERTFVIRIVYSPQAKKATHETLVTEAIEAFKSAANIFDWLAGKRGRVCALAVMIASFALVVAKELLKHHFIIQLLWMAFLFFFLAAGAASGLCRLTDVSLVDRWRERLARIQSRWRTFVVVPAFA